ncbi:MAG: DUF2399 domain-containing protein [Granulosicoccus sp.]
MSTSKKSVPASLLHDDLVIIWQAARRQLERYGLARRGTVSMPRISDAARLRLSSLLSSSLTSRLDLALLEQALVAKGIGENLDQALDKLGAPASQQRLAERAVAQRRQVVRQCVDTLVKQWPETWATTWANWLFQSGQMMSENEASADALVSRVRAVLDRQAETDAVSIARNELAVSVCGSAHALDDGVLMERCARRALWHAVGERVAYGDGRIVWNAAGIHTDRVSAPVLAWHLPLVVDSVLGRISTAANAAQVPIHLTTMALSNHAVVCDQREPVLLVENPRLVEAAAERQLSRCVIATNGQPSTAVMQLVLALLHQGVEVRQHADFDAAGIGICRRLAERGCTPWLMNAQDYQRALRTADKVGLDLPRNETLCGDTPWDPQLQHDMNAQSLVVHEELIVDELLDTASW